MLTGWSTFLARSLRDRAASAWRREGFRSISEQSSACEQGTERTEPGSSQKCKAAG